MTAVDRYVDREFDRFCSELQAICRLPGVPGRDDMDAVAGAVAERLADLGAQVKLVGVPDAPPVVLGRIGIGSPVLMLYNHYDVQPPEPLDQWDCDPYAAPIVGGRLIARGACDNRGNLMARIHAVEALINTGAFPGTVLFLVEGEEEIGSPHLAPVIDRYRDELQADGCVWETGDVDRDGRCRLYLGSKGICYLELEVVHDRPDLHSSLGAVTVNPLWRITWALASIKGVDERVLVDGFYDSVRPPGTRERELAAGADLGTVPAPDLGLDPAAAAVALLLEPTATVCGIYGGYDGPGSKTVLPARAGAKIDFRLVPDQDPDEIERLVRAHLDRAGFKDVSIRPHGHLPPARTDPDAPVVIAAAEAARSIYGREPVVMPSAPGSGPMWLFTGELGIPTVSFGIGRDDSLSHAPNENIRLSDYRTGIHMVAEMITGFARQCGERE